MEIEMVHESHRIYYLKKKPQQIKILINYSKNYLLSISRQIFFRHVYGWLLPVDTMDI